MTTISATKEKIKGFRRTETKLEVIKHIATFFCISVNHLCILIYGKVTRANNASVNRTLRLLEAEGFTKSLKLPSNEFKTGGDPWIHGFTEKGVQKAQYEGLDTPATKVFKPNSETFLSHEYEITIFHFGLYFLCQTMGWQLYWQQRDVKCGVNPDAYFRITIGDTSYHYFLEVEKSHPGHFRNGQSQLMRKMDDYFDYFNSDQCEKEWNFRKFRLIVLMRNEQRVSNFLAALAEKHANRMFWATNEARYKAEIAGEIFRTPKDYEKVAYSFQQP